MCEPHIGLSERRIAAGNRRSRKRIGGQSRRQLTPYYLNH